MSQKATFIRVSLIKLIIYLKVLSYFKDIKNKSLVGLLLSDNVLKNNRDVKCRPQTQSTIKAL